MPTVGRDSCVSCTAPAVPASPIYVALRWAIQISLRGLVAFRGSKEIEQIREAKNNHAWLFFTSLL